MYGKVVEDSLARRRALPNATTNIDPEVINLKLRSWLRMKGTQPIMDDPWLSLLDIGLVQRR